MDVAGTGAPDPLDPDPLVVTLTGPRQVEVLPAPRAPLPPGHVRVRTLYSGISAGTELTLYRGTNPHLDRRWDPDRRLFVDEAAVSAFPNTAWGYSEVGEVVELGTGADAALLGAAVWGLWSHRGEIVLPAGTVADRLLPAGLDPLAGTFARVGAVALNAVLAADLHIGETVAVFGQGVIGLIATQLATGSGADVIAVDGIAARREQAAAFGAPHVLDPVADDVGERIKELTGGRGADVIFDPVNGDVFDASRRMVAFEGRILVIGFVAGRFADAPTNHILVKNYEVVGVHWGFYRQMDPQRIPEWQDALNALWTRRQIDPLVGVELPLREAPEALRRLASRGTTGKVVLLP